MKKLLSVVLSFCIIMTTFALLSTSAGAADETFTSGDFEYKILEDETAEITGYIASETTVEVPAELDGYKVTSIGGKHFWVMTRLQALKFHRVLQR